MYLLINLIAFICLIIGSILIGLFYIALGVFVMYIVFFSNTIRGDAILFIRWITHFYGILE